MLDDVPPEYVPRDVDTAEHGVQARLRGAARGGGFLLLIGGSSVGKTRTAYEAVKALLPNWWLVHPSSPAEAAALAQESCHQTVVWLDELQRYLGGERGLTGGVVRALVNAPHRAVIIGTLRPEQYAAYGIVPTPEGTDQHAREREVLDLATVIRIGPEFSVAEQERARVAATWDPRLAIALEAGGYGLTQTLAAAPQLVARWEDARTARPYAWAVLTAALDSARLGARAPLSADFLRSAAPGYCTSQQRAEAPESWFEQALAYATGKLHGAAAALTPEGAGMGQVAGYNAADYLVQHANRERRYARVPASTWDAILDYLRDPADAVRIADSARCRLLYRYAIPLYRHAANAGDGGAADRLAELLAKRGDLGKLRARADTGDRYAAERLAGLLGERGDLDELRARADAGDRYAAARLAGLLAGHGDLDGLHVRADAGDWYAARRLALLLTRRGFPAGAAQMMRPEAGARDPSADEQLARLQAWLQAWYGDPASAAQMMRAAAEVGDPFAAEQLARYLAMRGDLDELRARADDDDRYAAARLAGLLAERGDLDELGARADAGDRNAAARLAGLLAERGDLDGAAQMLRAAADAGEAAAWQLAWLLAERGDLEGLRARADAGDRYAAERLAGLLAERGDLDELGARADAGDEAAAMELAGLLAERGDLDGAAQMLRAAADAGETAAWQLAWLLAERGDLEGLRARADAGDRYAAARLAGLLAERGDLDELRARADAGDEAAAMELADLLTKQGLTNDAGRFQDR